MKTCHLYISLQKISVDKAPDIRIKVLALKCSNFYLEIFCYFLMQVYTKNVF